MQAPRLHRHRSAVEETGCARLAHRDVVAVLGQTLTAVTWTWADANQACRWRSAPAAAAVRDATSGDLGRVGEATYLLADQSERDGDGRVYGTRDIDKGAVKGFGPRPVALRRVVDLVDVFERPRRQSGWSGQTEAKHPHGIRWPSASVTTPNRWVTSSSTGTICEGRTRGCREGRRSLCAYGPSRLGCCHMASAARSQALV